MRPYLALAVSTLVTLSPVTTGTGVTPPSVICFDHWEGDCEGAGSKTCQVTMTQNRRAVAFFEETPAGSCETG